MSKTDRYQTRLDPDHAERVDQYQDRHGLSQSEAVRRLILTGLDAEEGRATLPADQIRNDLERIREETATADQLDQLVDDRERADTQLKMNTLTQYLGGGLIALLLLALILLETGVL